jgi:putative tricarboxylic transport membrane protein
MLDGVDFLPVAIGLFGMGEVLAGAEEAASGQILSARYGLRDVWPTAVDWARSRWAIARGTVLGFAGRRAAGRRAHGRLLPRLHGREEVLAPPEEFGHGAIEGVAGPESANNAASPAPWCRC